VVLLVGIASFIFVLGRIEPIPEPERRGLMTDVPTTILIVMGVSGCGKSTVAAMLAGQLGWHWSKATISIPPGTSTRWPTASRSMTADRGPWLQAIEAKLDGWRDQEVRGVLTCSALKRSYRDRLKDGRIGVRFIYLKGDKELIASRLARRLGHFMPPDSSSTVQFATLEEPGPDEPVLTVPIGPSPKRLVETIVAELAKIHLNALPEPGSRRATVLGGLQSAAAEPSPSCPAITAPATEKPNVPWSC